MGKEMQTLCCYVSAFCHDTEFNFEGVDINVKVVQRCRHFRSFLAFCLIMKKKKGGGLKELISLLCLAIVQSNIFSISF